MLLELARPTKDVRRGRGCDPARFLADGNWIELLERN